MRMTIPSEARRYMKVQDNGCTGWRGLKYYGRPSWCLWMQRAVWEEANGDIPPRSTIRELCETIGCLTPDHLKITTLEGRKPATHCRHCNGILSRDKSNKTYCPLCMRERARTRRAEEI